MILDTSYSLRTKAHTLPSRTSRHTSQNLAKSVLFPTQKEIQFFFSLALEKIKTPDTQTDTTKTTKPNNNNGLQTRWTRTPAPNIGLVQCGATFFVSTFVIYLKFLLHIKISGKNPALHQAEKRCASL